MQHQPRGNECKYIQVCAMQAEVPSGIYDVALAERWSNNLPTLRNQ